MRISPEYRKLNQRFHLENLGYGAGGNRYKNIVAKLIKKHKPRSILDYGCGKGTLSGEFPEVEWQEYDPCVPGRQDLPSPADMVVCFDVLEHVEPGCIGEVLKHLRELTKRVFVCVIIMKPSNKILPDGQNAHVLIKKARWWKVKLDDYFPFGIVEKHKKQHKSFNFLWVSYE